LRRVFCATRKVDFFVLLSLILCAPHFVSCHGRQGHCWALSTRCLGTGSGLFIAQDNCCRRGNWRYLDAAAEGNVDSGFTSAFEADGEFLISVSSRAMRSVGVCRGTSGPDDVMQEIALIRNMKSAAEEERYADAGMQHLSCISPFRLSCEEGIEDELSWCGYAGVVVLLPSCPAQRVEPFPRGSFAPTHHIFVHPLHYCASLRYSCSGQAVDHRTGPSCSLALVKGEVIS